MRVTELTVSLSSMALHYTLYDMAVCVIRRTHGHLIQARKIDIFRVSKCSKCTQFLCSSSCAHCQWKPQLTIMVLETPGFQAQALESVSHFEASLDRVKPMLNVFETATLNQRSAQHDSSNQLQKPALLAMIDLRCPRHTFRHFTASKFAIAKITGLR